MKPQGVLSDLRKTIHFADESVPKEGVERLIHAVHAVPWQFGLHGTHYWVMTNNKNNKNLLKACMNNSQAADAPTLVVFSASRRCPKYEQEAALDELLESGCLTVEQAESQEQQMKMYFDVSPLGFGWFGKLIATPLLRLFTAMPQLACVHKREWLTRQVMRNATLFWHAAKTSGYSAEFIDMFDEWRLKIECGIPWHHVIVGVVALGYAREEGPKMAEINIDEVIHWQK